MRLFNDPPISRWGMLLAKWFGDEVITFDGDTIVVAYLWRDKVYIASCEQTKRAP